MYETRDARDKREWGGGEWEVDTVLVCWPRLLGVQLMLLEAFRFWFVVQLSRRFVRMLAALVATLHAR